MPVPSNLHVQDRDWLAEEDGQVRLYSARDIFADGLCRAFHVFGGDLQAGQQSHPL
jgi:hypothetical protein